MSSKKKILWLSHFLPYPAKGGSQIRSFNLIKQLSQYHDVTLFCLVHDDVVINYFDSVDSAIEISKNVFSEFCSNVHFLRIGNRNTKKIAYLKSLLLGEAYSVSRLDYAYIKNELSSFVEGTHYDAVHLDTLSLVIFKDIFEGNQIIMNHHNIESLMMYRRAKEQKNILMKFACYLDAWKVQRLEKLAASKIKSHIVCSDLDGTRLTELFPCVDVTTIPNGIDCTKVISKRNPEGRSLLFIGGLDWYPNTDAITFLLSQIWPNLNEQKTDFQLDIVGKNPPAFIKDMAAKYANVRLHGFVDDITPFYERAWLYICPIRDGGGTKLKVLDAMANGVPLLGHPIAMEGIDAVPERDYLQASTAQEFVDVILDLNSKSSDVLSQIGLNGRELIFSKYDYSRIGQKFAKIYE